MVVNPNWLNILMKRTLPLLTPTCIMYGPRLMRYYRFKTGTGLQHACNLDISSNLEINRHNLQWMWTVDPIFL